MAEPNTKENYSEPPWVTAENKLKNTFYQPNIDEKVTPKTKKVLTTYSNIPESSISQHVHEIRDKAWHLRPYPCIGLGSYLVPQLSQLPIYPEMLQRLSTGEILVDIGCFIGHDLRHLVVDGPGGPDGAPSENIYGVDIVNFWDLGYEMFRDGEKFHAKFIEGDILDGGNEELKALEGKCGIICISQVLHQWSWEGQVEACKRLVELSKTGSLVVGNQIGNVTAQAVNITSLPQPVWRHDGGSLARLWAEVGELTGTRWECEAKLKSFEEIGWPERDAKWMEEGVKVVEFVVRRAF